MHNKFNFIYPPKSLKEAVYMVFSFFDIFDYPLEIEQILRYLPLKNVDIADLGSLLNSDKNIDVDGSLFFIKGRESILKVRKQRKILSNIYWDKVYKYAPLLKLIPFIKSVSICNTLAINHPKESSDIDLFIITQKNRIFTARIFSTLLFQLIGVRRHGLKVAERFCLSFYISDDGMDFTSISLGADDIYLKYWMMTLVPVFGFDFVNNFLEKNRFMLGEFGIYDHLLSGKGSDANRKFSFLEILLGGKFGDLIEKLLEGWQVRRFIKRKLVLGDSASVIVNKKMLKFHNLDKRKIFNERFIENYKALILA